MNGHGIGVERVTGFRWTMNDTNDSTWTGSLRFLVPPGDAHLLCDFVMVRVIVHVMSVENSVDSRITVACARRFDGYAIAQAEKSAKARDKNTTT